MAIILVACLIPSNSIPKVNVPMMDKWVHFIAFACFSFAWSCTLKKVNFASLFVIVFFSGLMGWTIELLQASGITRGRSYENMDIVADTIGGILGVLIFAFVYKLFAKPRFGRK